MAWQLGLLPVRRLLACPRSVVLLLWSLPGLVLLWLCRRVAPRATQCWQWSRPQPSGVAPWLAVWFALLLEVRSPLGAACCTRPTSSSRSWSTPRSWWRAPRAAGTRLARARLCWACPVLAQCGGLGTAPLGCGGCGWACGQRSSLSAAALQALAALVLWGPLSAAWSLLRASLLEL